MKYVKLKARIGDVVTISDQMALKFEKIADDIAPVWREVPPEPTDKKFQNGSYITVTDELWFIYDHEHWRIMTANEHVEAYRQNYLGSSISQ